MLTATDLLNAQAEYYRPIANAIAARAKERLRKRLKTELFNQLYPEEVAMQVTITKIIEVPKPIKAPNYESAPKEAPSVPEPSPAKVPVEVS